MPWPVHTVTSFGYDLLEGGQPPRADLTFDVRRLADVAFATGLLGDDGHASGVQAAVLGARGAIDTLRVAGTWFRTVPPGESCVIAFGSSRGRHRGPVLALRLAEELRRMRVLVTVEHRHIHIDPTS